MKNLFLAVFTSLFFAHVGLFASLVVDQINGSRDLVYLQTPGGPVLVDGASEINFEIFLPNQPTVSTAELEVGGTKYDLAQQQAPQGFTTRYGLGSDNELYDVELSSGNSNWNSYLNQTDFTFSLLVEGNLFSYTHALPAQSELPNVPNLSISGNQQWDEDVEGDVLEVELQDSYTVAWSPFEYQGNYDYIKVSLQKLEGENEVEIFDQSLDSSDLTSFQFSGSLVETGSRYIFYVEFSKVAEALNPTGFSSAVESDAEPILFTEAISVTALDLLIVGEIEPDPVTVASDLNGNPVVVQVGDEYNWNNSLDGVILWSVEWESGEVPDPYTFYFIDGRNTGDTGFHDSISDPAPYDKPYVIDENGYLKVTETSFQYYNVVSVEDGVIGTIQDDGGINSVADNGTNIVDQWFFTTRVAAEEFYNSKLHYAPSSLLGRTIYIPERGYKANHYFTEDEAYYVIPQTNDIVDGIPYSYVANTSTTATLTLAREKGEDVVIHQISFSSPTTADSNWTDLDTNETGSATLQILTENYWPSSLAGWSYQGTSMSDTLYFVDEKHAVFYDASDSNFSNRELSNITYTWEQIGPRIGKLTTSLDEETLLFFESNTSGFFDWEEIGSDDGNSGQFELYYYQTGKAFESLVGSSISIGDTTYVFTSTNAVTIYGPSGTSSQEYAYLRENENETLLSVGSSLYKLDFHNHQYGRIIEGGSGYFSIHQNWATKGWVYYDDLPWIYSNNQGEWMYQILSINNEIDETELMYFEPWANLWSQNQDLNYNDQRVFSYWEDYDDFSGPELNSSKWDVAWWDGGTAPSIDQAKKRVEFTNGSSYEANLSDLMNVPNASAESEYSYGYDASYGFAPSTIADMTMSLNEYPDSPESADEVYFSNSHQFRYDEDIKKEVSEPYSYERTGPNTGKITIQEAGGVYIVNLTFNSQSSGIGTWEETEDGETFSGNLTFNIVFSPHSLLEFSQSDDIDGIEFELMIPDGAPEQTCIGLFAIDYNAMFNASSDEQEEGAIKFDLDLCYFNGNLTSEFNFKDQTTGQEISEKRNSTLGNFQKFKFYFSDGKIYFSLPGQEAKEYNFDRANEKFVIRAQNEQNSDFSAYLRNVRVLRKKSYPQGWMWTDYYPWVYSHETGGWLYFELAKDSDGTPVMNYYDHNSGSWDLYGPSLNQFTDR